MIFLGMVVLNFLTPLFSDDYRYYAETTSIGTILADEYHQYMTWTGRSVVHLFVRFFTHLPKPIFNIFNAGVMTFLITRIQKLALLKKTESKWLTALNYIFIFALLWLFTPKFVDVFLWLTGAINYSTAMVFMIVYLSIFHREVLFGNVHDSWPIVMGVFFFGVVAGWCNENTSGGTLLIAIGYSLIYRFYLKHPIKKWMFAGMIGNIVGLAFMLLAPGNKVRGTYFPRTKMSFFGKLLDGLPTVFSALHDHELALLILTISLFIIACLAKQLSEGTLISGLYLLGGLATIGVLTVAPFGDWWNRAYFGGVFFLIVSLVMSFKLIMEDFNSTSKLIAAGVYTYVILLAMFAMVAGMTDIFHNYQSYQVQEQSILKQKHSGKQHLVVPNLPYSPKTDYARAQPGDITTDPTNLYNKQTADYYGVKSIRTVKPKDAK